jgi:nucleotide-binding universal stress UspA family protein
MIERILVATDASDPSHHAVDMAADMAGKYGATLCLLHVIRDMQLPPELAKMAEVEKISGERTAILEYVGEKILDDAESRAKAKGAARIERRTARGDPATAILESAERTRADLILLGTRGLGKVKGMLLGSVSRKVLNLSRISCLVVR